MCTAVWTGDKKQYFGRNLDFENGFGEKITITPRNLPFFFGNKVVDSHYAIIGMALPVNGYPLYFDATNEKGLSMAGLLFPQKAVYQKPVPGKENLSSFQLIPRLLATCKSVDEAEEVLNNVNITEDAFSEEFPPSPLHWMIADQKRCLVLEQTKDGLFVYENPTGVLTNSPAFPFQMEYLNQYLSLSSKEPENRFSEKVELVSPSRGMGGFGLPGDLSSSSRFVRGCFTNLNAIWSGIEDESVSQFFHILNSVSQTMGCNQVGEKWEFTRYSSCCDTERGIYYYTTYHNSRISAVDLFLENLNGDTLITYELKTNLDVFYQNK